MTRVVNRTIVKVNTRLEVLTITLKEYLKAFGASKECLKSIDKGVYERHIIEYIFLKYYHGKKYCGLITLHIDWDKFQVSVQKENGNSFSFEEGSSISEQLDRASQLIIQHVNKMKKELGIDHISTSYRYRKEISGDKAKDEEAMKYLGHVNGSKSDGEIPDASFKTHLKFIMEKLDELEIRIDH